jgi:hypothetical protein
MERAEARKRIAKTRKPHADPAGAAFLSARTLQRVFSADVCFELLNALVARFQSIVRAGLTILSHLRMAVGSKIAVEIKQRNQTVLLYWHSPETSES